MSTATMTKDLTCENKTHHSGGKFLTFSIAGKNYGVEILRVQEIIGMMDITPVPRTPKFVKGVINLRGKIIPIIDLRLKFGMEAAERTQETCIIVVDVGNIKMGTIVDKVSEVLNIAAENIEDTPSFGVNVDTKFILGMGKTNENVTILLNIREVLTQSDTIAVLAAAEQGISDIQERSKKNG